MATDEQLVGALLSLGGETIVDTANQRRRQGLARTATDAVVQVVLNTLEGD
jgi:hypothetical protein